MNSRILIYYILLFTSSSILSQEVQYFDSYEISERLPVQDLTFDHRTLLWCHFKQSCATFDGVDFNFTKLSGLENQNLKFLCQNEDQTLFYSNENIHSKHRKTGLVISNLLPNQKRDIEWVKSYGDSIYLYNNNKLELYLFSDNKLNLVYNVIVSNIQDLVKTEDGQLFIATKAGLRVLLDGTWLLSLSFNNFLSYH